MDALSLLVGALAGFLLCALFVAAVFMKLSGSIAKVADVTGQWTSPEASVPEPDSALVAVKVAAAGAVEGRRAIDTLQGLESANAASYASGASALDSGTSRRRSGCRFCRKIRSFLVNS